MSDDEDDHFSLGQFENRKDLAKSLKRAQLNQKVLEAENATLTRNYDDAHAQLTTLRTGGRKKIVSTLPYVDDLRLLGKKYCVTGFPWPEKHLFSLDPLPESSPPFARFQDEDSYSRAAAGDLLAYVPEQFHGDMLNGTEFPRLFCNFAKDQRSVAVSDLINNAGIILGKDPHIFKHRKEKRSEDPEILAYLRWPGKHSSPAMAPILFANHREGNPDTLFQSMVLVLALRTILFKQTSLRGAPINNTVGKMWQIKTITAPMIAMAAVMMRYVVSDDTSFQKVGASSRINYWKDFRAYHAWLEKNQGTELGRRIFSFFNKHVFADIWNGGEDMDEELGDASDNEMDDFETAVMARFRDVVSLEESEFGDDAYGGENLPEDFEDSEDSEGHDEAGAGVPEDYFANHYKEHVATDRTATIVSTSPSSGLVPPEASTPGISTAARSAGAVRSRPLGPPTIIRAQPAAPAPSSSRPTPAHPPPAPAHPPVPNPPRPRPIPKRSPASASEPASDKPQVTVVLSTVVEESETSTTQRQTRRSSRSSKQTVTPTSISANQAAVHVEARGGRVDDSASQSQKTKKVKRGPAGGKKKLPI